MSWKESPQSTAKVQKIRDVTFYHHGFYYDLQVNTLKIRKSDGREPLFMVVWLPLSQARVSDRCVSRCVLVSFYVL